MAWNYEMETSHLSLHLFPSELCFSKAQEILSQHQTGEVGGGVLFQNIQQTRLFVNLPCIFPRQVPKERADNEN